jgi:basic membrane protein A and related proteins
VDARQEEETALRSTPKLVALVASAGIIIAACSSSGTSSSAPAASSTAPSASAASTAPSPSSAGPSASESSSPSAGANLKIGVVTDIGTLDDKNYNEYSYKGAQDGATALGAAKPPAVVPKDQSEYAADIQKYVDQKFDMIITVGFNLTGATVTAAKKNPTIKFIGVDQSPICVTPTGDPDTKFACKGDAKTLLPNYTSIYYAEDQAGYLAGIVAASASKSGTIGAIGGTSLCGPCVRYIQGYELGAKSVNPNIVVKTTYATNDFSNKAFNDPVYGKSLGQSFISTNKVDVIFQVAGKTGNGILDAACGANIYGIGVDVDQFLSYPNADKCIITSAEKKLVLSVSDTIKAIAGGQNLAGDVLYNAKNDGIGVSDFHDKAGMFDASVTQKLQDAMAAMKAGTLTTCPEKCGVAG